MPPRNRKTQMRAIDWRGQPSPAARAADAEYRAHLIALGLIEPEWTPPVQEPFYLPELGLHKRCWDDSSVSRPHPPVIRRRTEP